MGLVDLSVFLGTRCRLFRRKDAKVFNGWIKHFRGAALIVTTDDQLECAAGEQFYVEVAGPRVKACLDVVKTGEADTGQDDHASPRGGRARALKFQILGHVQLAQSDEQSRVLVSGMSAELSLGSIKVSAWVHDVSESGLGLVLEEPLASGVPVELQLHTPAGTVLCTGTVVYAKPCENGARIGVSLDEMSRIDGSRWSRLLADVA
ncbi:MAG: PilZ domain-containing protein [Armatimonadetes bacterium]|nr:PilZ domain-containing protein [Armatimonadota bacterium]